MSDNINYFWETNWIYKLLPCAPTLYKFSSSLPLPLLHHQHCSRWSTPLQTNTSMPLGKAAGVTCNNSALCPSKHFCPFQMECMAFKQLTKWWLGGGDMARVAWWLLEKSLRPAAPVCDDCFLAIRSLLCSGCCVLWWYILQRVGSCITLYHFHLTRWLTVWCISWHFWLPRGQKCVCLCVCVQLTTIWRPLLLHLFPLLLLPRRQRFYKSTSDSLGALKWALYVSHGNSIH